MKLVARATKIRYRCLVDDTEPYGSVSSPASGEIAITSANLRLKMFSFRRRQFVMPAPLSERAAKGSSQNDEWGIIAAILEVIQPTRRFFVEFGVGPRYDDPTYSLGLEGNCVDLKAAGWEGLFMDAGVHPPHLGVREEVVTADNINLLLHKYRVPRDFSVLSIDVDGQDIWIWKALKARPELVIIEYNPTHGPNESVAVPFNPNFKWDCTNYYGASLAALNKIGRKKGYRLVCVNWVNAFFVLDCLIANKSSFNYEELYRRHSMGHHSPDPLQRAYVSV